VAWRVRRNDGKVYREHTEYVHKKDSYRPGRREHLSEVRDDLRQGVGIAEFLALIPQPTLSVDTDGVNAFFARSWFQRLWVIQEVVLAKNLWIFCGDFTFDWTGLSSLTNAYKERVDVVGQSDAAQRAVQGLSTVQLVSFLREDHGEFGSLTSSTFGHQTDVEEYCVSRVTLIQAFAPSSATDVRDRIYGPLALTNQICKSSPQLQFKPDYELAIETTFYDFGIFVLGQKPTLSYLSLCKTANSNQPRILPSWVPDLRARSQQKPISWLTKCNATAGWDKRSKSGEWATLDVFSLRWIR
jgi:hypothetical protein